MSLDVPDFTHEIAETTKRLNDLLPTGPEIMRDWAAATVQLPPAECEEARQTKIAVLRGLCQAPARLVDAYLSEARGNGDGKAADAPAGLLLEDADPWPDEVDGAALLDELADTYSRFVALPDAGAEALALYTVLTFVPDAFFICPILAILSVVKRSGKTTALAVLLAIASRPLPGSNITPSALFRAVDKHHPTLVIDEADSFLRDNEEMRGILNAGHTRSTAYVIRNVPVGDGYEPMQFSVWCPKAVAGIGKLAATLEDRSVIIHARRRAPGEHVERLRLDRLSELEHLRRKCRRWGDDNFVSLGIADPDMPPLTSDRATDNWRPLMAIAQAAGGEWPDRARWAAIVLSGGIDETDGAAVQLLSDVRDLFASRSTDRLTSEEVVHALAAMEERPWPEWYHGKPITTRQVAKVLHPFNVKPKVVRVATGTARGYSANDFADAWNRYLNPLPGESSVTNVTSLQNDTFSSVTASEAVTEQKPMLCREVTDVTDETPQEELPACP